MPDRLQLAILSMDAYDRGYNRQLAVNTASLGLFSYAGNEQSFSDLASSHSSGFAASRYTFSGGTIISYRGTDSYSDDIQTGGSDLTNGWTIGGGDQSATQAGLAIKFYEDVTAS